MYVCVLFYVWKKFDFSKSNLTNITIIKCLTIFFGFRLNLSKSFSVDKILENTFINKTWNGFNYLITVYFWGIRSGFGPKRWQIWNFYCISYGFETDITDDKLKGGDTFLSWKFLLHRFEKVPTESKRV